MKTFLVISLFIGYLALFSFFVIQSKNIDKLNDDLRLFEDEYKELDKAFMQCDSVYNANLKIDSIEKSNREWHENKYK